MNTANHETMSTILLSGSLAKLLAVLTSDLLARHVRRLLRYPPPFPAFRNS